MNKKMNGLHRKI